jgi:hypothetical protein
MCTSLRQPHGDALVIPPSRHNGGGNGGPVTIVAASGACEIRDSCLEWF